MNILTFSTLFPNAADPSHGVFVENRLRHLVVSGFAQHRVVAPVPWVPPGLVHLPRYRKQAAAPRSETRHGIEIDHPRFAVSEMVVKSYTKFTIGPYFCSDPLIAGVPAGPANLS